MTSTLKASLSNNGWGGTLTGLSKGSTYYYCAYVVLKNGNDSKTVSGSVEQFSTLSQSEAIVVGDVSWLELPSLSVSGNQLIRTLYGSNGERNYSYLYDKTYYASLWEAYPLKLAHTKGSKSSSWSFNPDEDIDEAYQVDVVSNSYGTQYGNKAYSRGHQVPNADRKSDSKMNSQTYYVTNQTPQLQNKFNGSIWGNLETAVRGLLDSDSDIVYVVTGPVYKTKGGSETINYLTAKSDVTPSKVPIPNYYWKVLLKVKTDSSGNVTSASAIGFWFKHKDYGDDSDSTDYADYAVSVAEIERKTGFDFFSNLPDSIESTAEANTSWDKFKKF
ncbi:MAG: DNA/RNA non-specific endonuclease [Bacteroidales bacterium]|nr:DNA/RNA non-specific endonuclease [Bacteroidales bacterium]